MEDFMIPIMVKTHLLQNVTKIKLLDWRIMKKRCPSLVKLTHSCSLLATSSTNTRDWKHERSHLSIKVWKQERRHLSVAISSSTLSNKSTHYSEILIKFSLQGCLRTLSCSFSYVKQNAILIVIWPPTVDNLFSQGCLAISTNTHNVDLPAVLL